MGVVNWKAAFVYFFLGTLWEVRTIVLAKIVLHNVKVYTVFGAQGCGDEVVITHIVIKDFLSFEIIALDITFHITHIPIATPAIIGMCSCSQTDIMLFPRTPVVAVMLRTIARLAEIAYLIMFIPSCCLWISDSLLPTAAYMSGFRFTMSGFTKKWQRIVNYQLPIIN